MSFKIPAEILQTSLLDGVSLSSLLKVNFRALFQVFDTLIKIKFRLYLLSKLRLKIEAVSSVL